MKYKCNTCSNFNEIEYDYCDECIDEMNEEIDDFNETLESLSVKEQEEIRRSYREAFQKE